MQFNGSEVEVGKEMNAAVGRQTLLAPLGCRVRVLWHASADIAQMHRLPTVRDA